MDFSRLRLLMLLLLLLPVGSMRAETGDEAVERNTAEALKVLAATIEALGGDRWLQLKGQMREGHIATFNHGKPNPGTTKFWEFHAWPDHDRTELTSHRDVVQLFVGDDGWEVTYKGKKAIPAEQLDEFLRRRNHSVEMALKRWLKDPKTILMYEGQHLAARHLADQVTLISAENESITLLCDVESHLPLRRIYSWRDPVYKDKNTEAEEYDDYHTINGLPTAFTVTRFRNEEMMRQSFLDKIDYSPEFSADFWNADAISKRLRK